MAKSPYTPPTLQELRPALPCDHVTVYEFRAALSEWYLPDLIQLHDLLCMAQHARVSVDVLNRFVSENIERTVNKIGAST